MEFSPYVLEAAGQVRNNLFGGLEGTWTTTSGATEATFPRYQVTLSPLQRGFMDFCLIRARRSDVYDSVTAIFGKGTVSAAFSLAAYTVDRGVTGGRLRLAGKTRNIIDTMPVRPAEVRAHIGNQIEVRAGEYYALASIVQNFGTTGDYPTLGEVAVSNLLPAAIDTEFPISYGYASSDNVTDFPATVDMSSLTKSPRAPWLAFSKMPKD
ncbi:hypothetical protein [Nocardia brasiliensis]|uniref:hypothetical protein n=1 Tax=Nocardia brasiliensis TaxID=37326 RepID=UPI0024583F51|nr:hypothetical protein [Nocardia brasiliensis]